ncbi:DUF983 domain-containing protein [Salibacteraceae bacterium]|nr:DUF983 domain-containing protein [Salibacteraceae bacterium]
MKKGSKLYSILGQKCPTCHEGDMFEKRNPYILKNIWDMRDGCSNCGQRYQLEPSFFYGAMYVNYGITIGIALAIAAIMMISGSWEKWHYLAAISAGIIGLAPITFRIGRMVWINMFVGYKPDESD